MLGIQLQQAVVAVQGIQKTLSDNVEQLKVIQTSMVSQAKPDPPKPQMSNQSHREYSSSPCRSLVNVSQSGMSSPNRPGGNCNDLMNNPASAGSLLRPQHGLPPLAARGRPHFHPGQMDDSIQVISNLKNRNYAQVIF